MKGYFLSIWNILDPLYFNCTRLMYLPTKEADNIFRVRLTRYKGRDLMLSDGTQIKKNDILVKIHLHNVRLLNELKHLKSEIKKARLIYQRVQRLLPAIERYIRDHEYSNEIQGIIGITSLNRGCERLGFEVIAISHPVYKWFKWISHSPIMFLSTTKPSFKKIGKQPAPSYLFMSKDKLSSMHKT
ncbi:YkoP family protein [Neobacillus sp. NRS-1170]|uniref:YkoP family protein n=1 Tax=Neobacillus sp. NRS-1170 TaxID=3233898 RepID=UPI003D2B76DE